MSIPLTINGTTYEYPETNDQSWGPDATQWASGVTNGMLQKAGGLFQLLAEVDFGTAFGVKSLYYKSRTASVASAGQLRLARADVVSWRNQAGDGDLDLGVNSSNVLTFNGVAVGNFVSVLDTNSIDLTLSAGVLSADLKLSSAAATAGSFKATSSIETDGLLVQAPIATTSLTGFLSSTDWNTFNGKQAAGNYITALTGDATAAGPGSAALTLATVNSNVGSFGGATTSGTFTVNAKGLITAASSTSIQIAESQVTNLVSDLAAKQSTTLTSAHILVGNVSNVATDVAMSGDVTISNAGVTAIGNNKVTNAQLAQVSTATFKGRTTAGTGNVEDLTATQATALLNAMVGDSGSGGTKGLVPAPSSGDATKFLNGAGAWSTPSGAGDVTGPGSATDNAVARFDNTTGKLIQNSGVIIDDSNNVSGIANATLSGYFDATQIATPSNPSASHNRLYFKSDGQLYYLNSSGVESTVNTTGALYGAKSADYTVTTTDNYRTIGMTTSSTTRTVTLPAAASSTNRVISITKQDTGTGFVIVDANASETINGVLTYTLYSQGETLEIQCDGSNWSILSRAKGIFLVTTSTVTGSVSNPTKGTGGVDTFIWRRNGDSIEGQMQLAFAVGGSAGSGNYLWTLPASLSADTTKCPTATLIGCAGTGVGRFWGYSRLESSTAITMVVGNEGNASTRVGSGTEAFNSTSPTWTFNFNIPINGWV